MTPRFVCSVVTAVLLAGACSSSSGTATTSVTDAPRTGPVTSTTTPGATSTTASTTTPATTSTTTPATTSTTASVTTSATTADAAAIDRETARTALITLSMFPDGWVEDPVEDEDDDADTERFEAEFDACLGRDDETRVGDEIERLKVRTGDFHPVDDATTTVSHEVVLAPDVDTALAAMAEVRIDGAEPCLAGVIGQFYRSEFAADPDLEAVGIGEVVVTRTEEGIDHEAVGVLLEVPLTIGDQTVSQFLKLLYQRRGRALSELSFSSFGAPFDRDRYIALGDEVAMRIGAIGD